MESGGGESVSWGVGEVERGEVREAGEALLKTISVTRIMAGFSIDGWLACARTVGTTLSDKEKNWVVANTFPQQRETSAISSPPAHISSQLINES